MSQTEIIIPPGETLELQAGHAGALGSGPAAVLAIITQAVARGVPADTMEALQRMYHVEQDRAAAREFAHALASFQDECPVIPKSSLAKIPKRDGGEYTYRYADLEEILTVVREPLRSNGLSLQFDASYNTGMLTCIGRLLHVNGHSTQSSFTLPSGSNNPGMSDQQKVAGAMTFAKRNVVASLLGLIIADHDPEAEQDASVLTDDQAATIDALIDETLTDRGRFLKWANATSVEQIRQTRYGEAVRFLERKRKQA